MAAKKKPAKKPAKKKTSTISDAQRAAVERRLERDSLRHQAQADANARADKATKETEARAARGEIRGPKKYDPNQPYNVGMGPPPQTRDNNPSLGDAAYKIAGLVTNLREQNRQARQQAAATPQQPLANPDLYGTGKNTLARLNAFMAAQAEQKALGLKNKGRAVYMGAQRNKAKVPNRGPQRIGEDGKSYTETAVGEAYLDKNVLLSWLSDPAKLDQIKAAAEAAGLQPKNTDDLNALWTSVVNQAADSYSLAGKKVTPWALIKLRGRYSVNGKPADKVTTNTTIDQMDPTQARQMFEQTAQNMLGRAPTKAEVDDFIAKAQTIAKENPEVRKTVSKVGFDGELTGDSTTTVTGGSDVVNAQASQAAMDQAKQSEDYASYQAAGNYFPMLFDALKSPV